MIRSNDQARLRTGAETAGSLPVSVHGQKVRQPREPQDSSDTPSSHAPNPKGHPEGGRYRE